MIKLTTLFFALGMILLSCRHQSNTSITVRESDQYYSMKALFNENRTREVEAYMDENIGDKNEVAFANTEMDAQITLDDHTFFYLKKFPGHVELKLNKYKNTPGGFHRIKAMCEGIKEVLSK